MDQKLVKININIAGRSYPVKVNTEEERVAKDLEKEVNTRIQLFQKSYPSMDIRDCLSMVIIERAFDKNNSENTELITKAKAIEGLLTS